MLLSYYSDNRMTAKGLTRRQRQEVKQIVLDHYVQRMRISNTIDKIEQLKHVTIGSLNLGLRSLVLIKPKNVIAFDSPSHGLAI
jgi:hypothetical protein